MDTKESILTLLGSVKREGMSRLTKFLEESSFFADPASCEEHNSYVGGLAEHSLNVFFLLENYIKTYPELKEHIDSIKVISLLHDVSLIGTFQKVNKNATVRGSDGKNLRKENGKLMFVERE